MGGYFRRDYEDISNVSYFISAHFITFIRAAAKNWYYQFLEELYNKNDNNNNNHNNNNKNNNKQ